MSIYLVRYPNKSATCLSITILVSDKVVVLVAAGVPDKVPVTLPYEQSRQIVKGNKGFSGEEII